MIVDNQEAYNSTEVVKEYKEKTSLFKGEKALIENLKNSSARGKMLDIGVGTGRTTKYFSNFFDEYVGIDYAEEMVKVAKETFGNDERLSFYHLDATNMEVFKDNEFDFILFSFNGLDFVSFEDRQKILKEIKRIGKPNAVFSYSTHNIYNVPQLFSFNIPRNPFNIYKEFKRYKTINKLNEQVKNLIKKDYDFIFDGSVNFEAEFYYCNPKFELKLLSDIGFKPFEYFSLKTGEKYESDAKWEMINTPWIMINSYING